MEHSRQAAKRARHRDQLAARAAREEDKRRKETERQQRALEERRREIHEQQLKEDAVVRTEKADKRIQQLFVVLRASLKSIPGELDLEALKHDLPDVDLGLDSVPFPLPQWTEYAPTPPSGLGRLLRRERRDARMEDAENAYANALERYRAAESERRQRVEQLQAQHSEELSAEQREIREHNQQIDEFRAGVFSGNRYAVTDYYERVYAQIVDKLPIPRTKHIAYVPESKLLVVEWHVPGIEIVPREKEYQYFSATKSVEISKWRPIDDVRETYHNLMAQLALRGVATAFSADPNWLVETVVFNAVTAPAPGDREAGEGAPSTDPTPDDPQPAPDAGQCVFTMRATRNQFEKVKLADLTDTEPLEQARKRFAAKVSPFPEERSATAPVLPYDLAAPTASAPDEATADAARQDLWALSTHDLDALIEQLLERIGYTVQVVRPEDDDCDLIATRSTAQGNERLVVHLRRVTRNAGPADSRALMQAVRKEQANAGMLLVTGGFDTRAFQYATGKPLHLYDGHCLLALLRKYGLAPRTPETGPAPEDSEAPLPQQRGDVYQELTE